jgi:ParB-like chromosome segregation protein Spo0J
MIDVSCPATGSEAHRDRTVVRPELLPVASLRPGWSPRTHEVDIGHVRLLVEMVYDLPPVTVHRATMTIVDGHHRVEAFRQVGKEYIRAFLVEGTQADAFLMGVRANIAHGKPLTLDERRAAARVILREFPERSDRWVSEACGLSHSTVGKLRASVPIHDGMSATRLGRDGRRRAVSRVSLHSPADQSNQHMARSWDDDALRSSKDSDIVAWLARTAVDEEHITRFAESVPISRVYVIADECQRRARAWQAMARVLEQRARCR